MKQDTSVLQGNTGRRAEILDIAAKLFEAKGYHATTIQDLADAAGMTKAGLYYHFASKEDILYQVIMHYGAKLIEATERALETHDTAPNKLADLMIRTMDLVASHQPYIAVYFQEKRALPKERLLEVRTARNLYRRRIQEVIAEGIARGEIRDDLGPATLIEMAMQGMLNWSYHWLRPDGRYSAAEVGRMFANMILGGIASSPPLESTCRTSARVGSQKSGALRGKDRVASRKTSTPFPTGERHPSPKGQLG